MPCAGGGRKNYSDADLAAWLGAIKARQPEVSIPSPDIIDRGTGEFWQLADLRLAIDLDMVVGAPDPHPFIHVLTAGTPSTSTRPWRSISS